MRLYEILLELEKLSIPENKNPVASQDRGLVSRNMVRVNEAKRFMVPSVYDKSEEIPVFKNPTRSQLSSLVRTHGNLRGAIFATKNVYVWDAMVGSHGDVADSIEDAGLEEFTDTGMGWFVAGSDRVRMHQEMPVWAGDPLHRGNGFYYAVLGKVTDPQFQSRVFQNLVSD